MAALLVVEVRRVDRMLRFAQHAASSQTHSACFGPLATRQFAGLTGLTLVPSRVLLPPLPQLKKAAFMAALLVVEMVGVEPTSESISAGISPSAVNDLKFRFSGRPLTGCRSGYPVSPLKYREILQSFPV